MDFIAKDRILRFKPDTLERIRKEYNLEKPGQMKELVEILRDWVQKQRHFKKKDFTEHYYEITIIACKGSLERAKTQLDRLYTLRTLLPQYFGMYNVKEDFSDIHDKIYTFVLPELADDNYRVEIVKLLDADIKSSNFMDYYRSIVIFADYLKAHDYMLGFILIVDFTEANLMDFVTKTNPIELRQAMSIYIEGYGMRIKAIHIVSGSKFVDAFVKILKQVLSTKVAGRIHIHKTIEDVYEHIPKSTLPKDYGGEERSLKELQDEWVEALSSEEHLHYISEMSEASTDESLRQTDKFNEQCAGMPGTFRLLSVD